MLRAAVFLAMLAASTTAEAACPGQFAKLTSLAGGPRDQFLTHPAVSQRMTRLMGQELTHLKKNLSVAGPVALIHCELVVEGNAPHKGGEQNAILSFNLYSGITTVAILDGRRVVLRSTLHRHRAPDNYSHLPAHVRDWIFVAANSFRSRGKPPANVTILPPPSP
ncbi:MAG: hypothetical protein M3Q19_04650 [Pseudomonadota bacterium]|nr:hypothetical protein [Pseudomonadota bacterium]